MSAQTTKALTDKIADLATEVGTDIKSLKAKADQVDALQERVEQLDTQEQSLKKIRLLALAGL